MKAGATPQPDRDCAIVVGVAAARGESTRWGGLLVVFMRVVALLWLAQGLAQWRLMLVSKGVVFDHAPPAVSVAIAAFAVLDLLAAVGLWLATPWGGVVWLLVIFGQIVATFLAPGFYSQGAWVVTLDCLLLGAYLFLTWRAGYDPNRRSRSGWLQRQTRKLSEKWRRSARKPS